MQNSERKRIAIFGMLMAGVCLVTFGAGIFVGRQFPAHRFERFGNSRYLLDPTTGKICDPFKSASEPDNAIDRALGADNTSPAYDANGFRIATRPSRPAPNLFDALGSHGVDPTQQNDPLPCGK